MKTNFPHPKSSSFSSLIFKQALKYLGLIWILTLAFSLFCYFFANTGTRTYWYILNTSFFYINIPLFCFALLSLVAERGLFNGIRYSIKQAKAHFFKSSRSHMFYQYNVSNEKELKQILQEKYLYTSPKSTYTMPLLLASGFTFLLMVLTAIF